MPDSLPLTEESRDRLREQANQLPEPTVLRLIDLLAVVIEDERQGGDPRLPLELALVKVTRPQSDLARESLVHRVEVLESRLHAGAPAAESWGPSPVPAPAAGPAPVEQVPAPSDPAAHEITLEQMHEAWTSGASSRRSRSARSRRHAALRGVARPGSTATRSRSRSSRGAEFHRRQVDEPKNLTVLRDALYEVTGRGSQSSRALADGDGDAEAADDDGPAGRAGAHLAAQDRSERNREVEEIP